MPSAVRRATIQNYDSATHTATVLIAGSLGQYVESVPVSRAVSAGALIAGRTAAVLFFDDQVPTDSMIVGVY
jgi:hypothetical protein